MMSLPAIRKPRHETTPIIAAVVLVAILVAGLLVWQNSQSQGRYSTLRDAQTTGAEQRTDQQQLTCALWAMLRDDKDQHVSASVRTAADKICSTVPTPTPTPTPTSSR